MQVKCGNCVFYMQLTSLRTFPLIVSYRKTLWWRRWKWKSYRLQRWQKSRTDTLSQCSSKFSTKQIRAVINTVETCRTKAPVSIFRSVFSRGNTLWNWYIVGAPSGPHLVLEHKTTRQRLIWKALYPGHHDKIPYFEPFLQEFWYYLILLARAIYTVRTCRVRQAYDRPTTWIVLCKSTLQLVYKHFVGF